MGVIVNKLSTIDLEKNEWSKIDIELNEDNVIHLQSNSFRIELMIDDFNKFSETVQNAYKNLKRNKGI